MHISLAPLTGEGYFLQKGAMQLAESLSRGTQELVKLDFSYCQLTPNYVLHTSFNLFCSLLELNLEGNLITPENNYLEELNLFGNVVPNELHTLQVDFSAEVLSDPQKRAIYDQYGEEGLKGQVPPPNAGGASFFHTGNGPTMFSDGRSISGVVRTPYYVAPKLLLGRDYNEKVDVWSSGVILYIMLSGVPPFHGESAAKTFEAVVWVNMRFPPRTFRSTSPFAKDLLRKMICRDVSRRLSADEQSLGHRWIQSGGEKRDLM
ncbi:hypothetical protein K1719_024198 [Acacia pycnantha]|nr:hypothetical protein K1719_024198 [Acacia pycnantha]